MTEKRINKQVNKKVKKKLKLRNNIYVYLSLVALIVLSFLLFNFVESRRRTCSSS